MSLPTKLHFVLAVFLAALGLAGVASAQDADSAERASQLFAEGQAAAKRKDWSEAYRLYRAAWMLTPSYDVAANVAHSAIKLGQVADGASFFAYALRHYPATGDAQKRATLTNYLDLAKQKVMTINVTTDPATAEVFVDGNTPIDTIFLEPGVHVIEARAPGYEATIERVTARAGAQRDLKLVLKQAVAPAMSLADSGHTTPPAPKILATPSPTSSAEERQSTRSIVPALVAGGVAALGIGAGIAFTLSADSKESEADDIRETMGASGCSISPPSSDCARLRDITETEDRHKTYAAVGFGVGALAAATVAGYFLWPSSDRSRNSAPGQTTKLSATPIVGTYVTGIVVRSGF